MKKSLAFIVFIFAITTVFAQPLRDVKVDKKLKIAQEQKERGDYYNALDWYMQVNEELPDDVEVIHSIAELHAELRDTKKAESWYRKVSKKDKTNKYPNAEFNLGRYYKMNGKLDEAAEALNTFISETSDATLKGLAQAELAGIALARNAKENEDITVADAGDNINSRYTDFSPVYSNDGTMYYASMAVEEVVVMDGKRKDYFAKIFKSSKQGEGMSKGQELSTAVNRPGVHTGNVTVSPDGERMYYTRTEFNANKMVSSAIYMSARTSDGWGAATKVLDGDYLVKQPTVGEMYGSEVLIFASDMAGGYGGMDLYYSKIEGDSYSSPTNLGDAINTAGDDVTPYYKDGTLYFSSTGHPGIGGLDVFSSQWSGSWNAPVNIGAGINSSYDDIYYSIDDSGYNGFVVSNRPSRRSLKSRTCCDDIYTVSIKEVLLDLRAITFDAKTKASLDGVDVQLVEMTKGKEGETANAVTKNGEAGFALAREMAYKIIVSKDGYKDASLEFNTVGLNETQTIDKKLGLLPNEPVYVEVEVEVYDTIQSQQPIRLNSILYDYNKASIRPESEADLNTLLSYMTSYTDMVIEMSSHTDSKGSESYNKTLSQKRAESAKAWLVEKGISESRIQAVGYGESMPVAENEFADGTDNPDGRQLNRRTEFKIISGPKFIVSKRIEKKIILKKEKQE